MGDKEGPNASEISLVAKLARASIMALQQAAMSDTPEETRSTFLLLPGMLPCTFDQISEMLAHQQRPVALHCFREMGVLVVGSCKASEDPERFKRRKVACADDIRRAARYFGRQGDARFLVQWNETSLTLSLPEALRWPTEYQMEFCDWYARTANPDERALGGDVVLYFRRPPDRQGGAGVQLR